MTVRMKIFALVSVLGLVFGLFPDLVSLVRADGMIVIGHPPRPDIRTPFPLWVKYHHVEVFITDQTAKIVIDQEFYNPTRHQLEGYYIFPIPEKAVFKNFAMIINGKEVEAELLGADKARKIYEDIVRRQIDPALLEYYGHGLFKARIFPIEPGSTKKVSVIYHEVLDKNNGTIAYLYPLNTEKFSSRPLDSVLVKVDIRSVDRLKSIFCTTHETELVRKGPRHAIMAYEARHVTPDRDFKLFYNTNNSKYGVSLVSYRERGEPGYFFLNITPDFELAAWDVDEKDVVFVLDASGSMAGEKLEQAQRALRFCVANLNAGDRFDIVRFSTEAEALFGQVVPVDTDHVRQARSFIKSFRALGGTNIEEALKLALHNSRRADRKLMIVFITDGRPTIGETNEGRLLKIIQDENTANLRIFTFGIGEEINTHLLDKITQQTKAYRSYIAPDDDIEMKISDFYTKVQSPVLSDIHLKFGNNLRISKVYPQELPDLFNGSSVSVMGRYQGSGSSEIILSGSLKGKTEAHTFEADFNEIDTHNDAIPSLWAARRIGYLLDQVRLNGEDKELVDEIVHLARRYGIITPYTSYLIVEDEGRHVAARRLAPENQTLGKVAPRPAEMISRSEADYATIREKSGKGSVRASKEIQALAKSMNTEQTFQGSSRLDYKDKFGVKQSLTQQVRFIQGRAWYNHGDFWVDSKIQSLDTTGVKRIKFASEEYFAVLKTHPDLSVVLSLGRNVRLAFGKVIYEIYE